MSIPQQQQALRRGYFTSSESVMLLWWLKINLNKSLTEWVLFCRVDSTPCRAVHVCSFSPALRFESSDFSKLCRSSSLPNSLCSLLKPDKLSPSVPRADQNSPSAKMPDTEIMFTRRLPNFGLARRFSVPTVGSTCPAHHQMHLQ